MRDGRVVGEPDGAEVAGIKWEWRGRRVAGRQTGGGDKAMLATQVNVAAPTVDVESCVIMQTTSLSRIAGKVSRDDCSASPPDETGIRLRRRGREVREAIRWGKGQMGGAIC